ncbi:MAG: Tfp pilus assembly protein FimT/FimU [Vulcanimicrobiota bacterium]
MEKRKGFTIIELIVTMGILCFLIALALPMYRSYTTAWACRNAAQILYSDLVLQRQKAFSQCLPTGVTIGTDGTYGLWELYNTSADLPDIHETSACSIKNPVADICGFLLSFVPVGCNELIRPVRSPVGFITTRTVSLSRDLAVPVSLSPAPFFIYFVPKRSDESAKWRYCYCTTGDITVASGAETVIITITANGDIVLN